jgi:hypothetical protein
MKIKHKNNSLRIYSKAKSKKMKIKHKNNSLRISSKAKSKKMGAGTQYTQNDLQRKVTINNIDYIEDKENPGTAYEDEIYGKYIPVNKAYILDSKIYNVDDLYTWIYQPLSNKSVPHSRRRIIERELQEIEDIYFTTNNLPRPSSISDDIKNNLIILLNSEYDFNHRHDDFGGYDMSENMGLAVRMMREFDQNRRNILVTYPQLNSKQVITRVLALYPRLLNEFSRWINSLPE